MSCFRGEGRGHGYHTSLNNAAPCGYFSLRSWLVITEGDTNPSTWCQKYGSILFLDKTFISYYIPTSSARERDLVTSASAWVVLRPELWNYDIMRPWALGTDEISARKSSAITTRLLANHFPNSSQIFFGRETRVVQRWEQTKSLLDDHKLLSQISSRWSGLLAQYLKQKLTYDFKWKWNSGQANIFDIRWL